MSHFPRTNGASSALSNVSSTSNSASTPSTVIHVTTGSSQSALLADPEVSTNPNPTPSRADSTNPTPSRAGSIGSQFRGKDAFRPENRVLPTSNFLINRHKLLRKTEEGKLLQDGGTLSGTRRSTNNLISNVDLHAQSTGTNDVKSADSSADSSATFAVEKNLRTDQNPDTTETRLTSISVNAENISENDNKNQTNAISDPDSNSGRQITSIRWSPKNNESSIRPQIPPKPSTLTTDSRVLSSNSDDANKQKQGRGILRAPSLRGSMTRSRTPSQGPPEERTPKKKEEFLHESVVYTKTKPEPPISGNRQQLLRGKQSNMTTSTRAEISSPHLVNSTADQSATSIQIRGPRGPRVASPSPQRTEVIPAPVQVSGKGTVQMEREQVTPSAIPVDIPIVPVYARLSEARTSTVKTSRADSLQSLPAIAAPSPAPSGFIKPQIRPTPPRKPVRTEITESLLEVLPQKIKRQAPPPPSGGIRQNRSSMADVDVNQILRKDANSIAAVGSGLTSPAIRRVTSPERPVSHLKTTEILVNSRRGKSPDGSSYAGHMTFDDEFESVMSSSHLDYEHSSADEADDLVKRSLVKASNRRAPIEDIQEENMTATAYVEVAPPSVTGSSLQPEYDRLPHRPLRQVVARKQSFLSSADDSDSSRGHPSHVQRSSVTTTTRVSRKETDTNAIADSDARQLASRDDSAGRRKYDERRQLLRNFENGLQRKRFDSSSIDSDTMDRDEHFIQQRNNQKTAAKSSFGYQSAGPKSLQSSSRYADQESDDGASDSVGIPEPLPEYEYPSRVQGRTIKDVQEIRETIRLRNDSSSTSSDTGHSPSRKAQKRDHHFSRHFDISAEELNTARSLINHRLPPTYTEPSQPVMLGQAGSRMSLADQSRTPPPTRPIMGGYSRPQSQSPDVRIRSGRLPPQSPHNVRGPPPVVHHSDGETRYFPEKKPKKKLGIVRRLSELVRGEKKSYKRDVNRKSSTSSMEQEQENRPPVLTAGVRDRKDRSPIRRYQDQPLRPVVHNPTGPTNVSRIPSFNRPIPNPRDNTNRHSGNFSDTGTASFVYQDQLAPQIPVYAQPNKLQKQQQQQQQNIGRYRSMSEYDMDRVGVSSVPHHNLRYVNKPINPSKSIESISESVWKEKLRGPARTTWDQDPPDEKFERVTRTTLIPWGKNKNKFQPAEVRNTAYVRSGIYDKNVQHYGSTPALPTMGQVDYRMGPPVKPPRRYDYDAANRSSDSDPSNRADEHRRVEDARITNSMRQTTMERSRPETELRLTTQHNSPVAHYSEPSEIPRRVATTSISSGGEDTVPRTNRFQSSIYSDTRSRQIDSQGPVVVRTAERQAAPAYARTRIAANDYANRRYHSAAADVNRAPAEAPLRGRFAARDPSEERRYKSSYKMLIENPSPSRGMVQERSRFFSNPPPRRGIAVRR